MYITRSHIIRLDFHTLLPRKVYQFYCIPSIATYNQFPLPTWEFKHLFVAIICTFSIPSEAEHLSTCLLVCSIYSLWNIFDPFPFFCLRFPLLICENSLCVKNISCHICCKYFTWFIEPFTCADGIFDCTKFFIFMWPDIYPYDLFFNIEFRKDFPIKEELNISYIFF